MHPVAFEEPGSARSGFPSLGLPLDLLLLPIVRWMLLKASFSPLRSVQPFDDREAKFFAATKVILGITIRSPDRMIVTRDRQTHERFVVLVADAIVIDKTPRFIAGISSIRFFVKQ